MRRLLGLFLLLWTLPLLATPPQPASREPDAEKRARDQAIAEALQRQEERKKWLETTTPEQRAAEREKRGRMPQPGDNYDWHTTAQAHKLDPKEIEQLAATKLLVGRKTYKQTFEAYEDASQPMFITSDSLLNAFHLLFEDTFRDLEIRRAGQLRDALEATVREVRTFLEKPPYPAAEFTAGWLQAQRAIGPAMIVLGSKPELLDASVRADIAAEVAKIRAATAVEMPAWLAPGNATLTALDYRRLRPVGFYAGNPVLADYFRAVRWLQLVPFRPERDHELGAIALLGYGANRVKDRSAESFFRNYLSQVGPPDGNSILDAENLLRLRADNPPPTWQAALEQERKWREKLKQERSVNDTLRTTDQPPLFEPFFFLVGAKLRDAVMFQSLANRRETPSSAHIAALLGSQWIQRVRPSSDVSWFWKDDPDLAGDDYGPSPYNTLYDNYLSAISGLFAPPDPDAPVFMSSDAWAAKSCQTALAGWAQMRHTFTLQTKVAISTAGMHDLPPGFIEPSPEFLRRFSAFLSFAEDSLRTAGTFEQSGASVATEVLAGAQALEAMAVDIRDGRLPVGDRPMFGTDTYGIYERFVQENVLRIGLPDSIRKLVFEVGRAERGNDQREWAAMIDRASQALRTYAGALSRGEKPEPNRGDKWQSLAPRWKTLGDLTARLETLVQKQLRQRDWTKEEGAFIKHYGSTLAYISGYFGNFFQTEDDAPRWAEITHDAQRDESFAAATGRPTAFYVLYPWKGTEILCTGVAIPFYEDHSLERLTDAEWRAKLDAKPPPTVPAWMQALPGAK